MTSKNHSNGLARKQNVQRKEQKDWWKDIKKKKENVVEKSTSNMTTKELKDLHNRNEDISVSGALSVKKVSAALIGDTWVQKEEDPLEVSGILSQVSVSGGDDQPKVSAIEMMAERHKRLRQYKIFIAHHSRKVMVNPKLVDSWNCLVDLLKENNCLISVTVRKYAALSLLRIFQDILPNYKINKNLLNNKMYKEKLDVVKGEVGVLEFYSKYLKLMEANLYELKGKTDNPGMQDLQLTFLKCLGSLLTSYPTFNFAMNICEVLVGYLNNKNLVVREFVLSYMKELVQNDKKGITSLTVVNKIYALVRKSKQKVKPEVLKVLLYLNVEDMRNSDVLKREQKEAQKAIYKNAAYISKISKKQDIQSRKEKKEKKRKAILANKIADIESKVVAKQVATQHSEILKMVLALLFQNLKSTPKSEVLSVVFQALEKFSKLINYEYFGDLLREFDRYLEKKNLSLRDSLNCLRTAYVIVNQQDEALGVDPNTLCKYVYKCLPKLVTDCSRENVEVMLNTLRKVLLERKNRVSPQVVMAFTKKLTTVCASLPHHSAQIPVLVFINSLIKSFQCNEELFENDPEVGSGQYDLESDDPAYCHSSMATLCELRLLTQSYHPEVARISKSMMMSDVNGYVRQFNGVSDLYQQYDINEMVFNPPIPPPKPVKGGKRKRALGQIRDMELHEKWEELEREESQAKIPKVEFDYFNAMIETQNLDEIPTRHKLHEQQDFSQYLLVD